MLDAVSAHRVSRILWEAAPGGLDARALRTGGKPG
jgi:hypothetical protein